MNAMRRTLVCLMALLLVSAAACGVQKTTPTQNPTPTATVAPGAEATAKPAVGQTLDGTIEELKSDMIIASPADGGADASPYVFGTSALGALPDGLKVGDKVTITYTGDLTDMGAPLEAVKIEKTEK